ncbi:MAG: hypothetical protein HUU38_13405 [Anaerolineales bacterium]|nr:hypothetical protein [Anaerolineales bacterium]
MPEAPTPYQTRRTRWLKLANHLPAELKDRIAIRNIRAVAGLTAQAQHTLALALDTGLRQASTIRYLQTHPDASLNDLIYHFQQPTNLPTNQPTNLPLASSADILPTFTALILTCFPGWPRSAAESLAQDPMTHELRALLHAWQVCQDSERAHSETFTVLLCGFLVQAAEQLNHSLTTHPNLRDALRTSGVAWPFSQSLSY